MVIWGVCAMSHDASIAVVDDSGILFAAQAERYSKTKYDPELNYAIVNEALAYGKPDLVVFYENVWKKKLRQMWHGDWSSAFDARTFASGYMRRFGIKCPVKYSDHHYSHAAAGYYTSKFAEATVVVLDALGEFQTATIWDGVDNELYLTSQTELPLSIGLLYSAITQRCGFKPNDEEYILMGLAAYGEPRYVKEVESLLGTNLRYGIGNWMPDAKIEDLAASAQKVCTQWVRDFIWDAYRGSRSKNLVYMGGVALNCVTNSTLMHGLGFTNLHIMPNPGDAGSSLGAALGYMKQRHWKGPYLGTDIAGSYDIDKMCDDLVNGEIIGVARGRAEFGPRALGNRSLLADPCPATAKDRVNKIKKRQEFRPFGASVLEEYASQWFDTAGDLPYMQQTVKCKRPEEVPAICHVDGTSRIQTVTQENHPQLYWLLMQFYARTGCPILLNTSLNIRHRPMVNDRVDAYKFSQFYKVKVY
jgi:carbamoyltransferase